MVFLFSHLARRLQFRIEKIRAAYPDCIAYRHAGDREKLVRIEFEYRSGSFCAHRHETTEFDCIVQCMDPLAIKSQCGLLDEDRLNWALSQRVTRGDLLPMYRTYPECCITEVFRFTGNALTLGKAAWRTGECFGGLWFCSIGRTSIDAP